MEAAGLLNQIPSEVREAGWNVNCRAVGESSAGIKYLAPCVFKVAISNSRIIKVENGAVTFRYKKPKSERWRAMTLNAMEFIRRFLSRRGGMLPAGFMKVRYFGFMNPNCKAGLQTISGLIELSYGFQVARVEVELEPREPDVCPQCGGALKVRAILLADGTVLRPG